MKVFITGITGFIGSHLARAFLDDGHDVSGLLRFVNRDPPALIAGARLYHGSLLDYRALWNILRDERPDVICHLGAITPVAYSFTHPHEVTETNFMGTVNLCEAARATLPDLRRFIFAGTAEEYGNQDVFPIPEDAELRAYCPYAVAKIGAEAYVRYCQRVYGFPAVCFRQANTYGRLDNTYFVVETILTQMLRDQECVKLGDPRPIRDLMHIEDLANAYRLALTETKLIGEVVNVSTGIGVSVEELVGMCIRLTGWSGGIRWHTRVARPGEVWNLTLDNTKIERLVGWKPQIALGEGLRRVSDYWAAVLHRPVLEHA